MDMLGETGTCPLRPPPSYSAVHSKRRHSLVMPALACPRAHSEGSGHPIHLSPRRPRSVGLDGRDKHGHDEWICLARLGRAPCARHPPTAPSTASEGIPSSCPHLPALGLIPRVPGIPSTSPRGARGQSDWMAVTSTAMTNGYAWRDWDVPPAPATLLQRRPQQAKAFPRHARTCLPSGSFRGFRASHPPLPEAPAVSRIGWP